MIRLARPEDALPLTELTFSAKRYWEYPEHYYDVWHHELTITEQYISSNTVYVYEESGAISGYYSLAILDEDMHMENTVLPSGAWLDHMFVRPDLLHHGIGTHLFRHLCEVCRDRDISIVRVLADPHARGFYEKLGWQYVGEFPSTIEGRMTPLLTFEP